MYKSAQSSIYIREFIVPKYRSHTPSPMLNAPNLTKTVPNSDALMKDYVFLLVKNMYPKRPNYFSSMYDREARSISSDMNSSSSYSPSSSMEIESPKLEMNKKLMNNLTVLKPAQSKKQFGGRMLNGRRGAVVFLNLD